MIVTKFGGSSLADASQFLKVQQILSENTDRRYVVPSAPGKRYAKDDKVTDLLYMCHAAAQRGEDFMPLLDRIRERYESIASDLEVDFDFSADFAAIADAFRGDASREYAASRGEYLNGKLLSAYLGFAFVDAADVIRFDTEGTLAEDETNRLLSRALAQHKYAVVPGFYGADELGGIHTFSRGGSDISGALVARAVNADVYENWTDVTGFRMADPRIVKDAQYIENLTYRELRELSYMGATVLHGDAVFPVRKMGIPTN
ncbi:MAG: aspartate kinase, partial [Clostridia bacterium]|nr:aspartate kinase [Clostridia bacterium]